MLYLRQFIGAFTTDRRFKMSRLEFVLIDNASLVGKLLLPVIIFVATVYAYFQ
jgi:hypothetical protein